MSAKGKKQSLSKTLLTRVLSVYFAITVVVTVGQISAEYFNAKEHIGRELTTLQSTFSASLTRSIWELNTPQALAIADGLMAVPVVSGVIVVDENGENIVKKGIDSNTSSDLGVFGYTFPLVFEFSGRETKVGEVTLFSTTDVVIDRIQVTIWFVLGNAFIKTTFLILLFISAFRKVLAEPLSELSDQIEDFNIDDLKASKLHLKSANENELTRIQDTYNKLIDDLELYKTRLNTAQNELREANSQLDKQNLNLEEEVAKKTANLSQAMFDLEQQKKELTEKNIQLETSMKTLKEAQDQLVESEKLASLGGLVAGIAHDVNTPIGIGITANSFLQERIATMQTAFDEKKLTASSMAKFLEESAQTSKMIMTNLNRASELVASFKQVAVDQSSDQVRDVAICQYLHEIIQSLYPKLKATNHKINVDCDESIVISSHPGILAQIFTNMIMNTLIHGFKDTNDGNISIKIYYQDDQLNIEYRDDGVGVTAEQLEKLFEAFYTTRKGEGGSGLGTHIMYNLVKQTLGGTISAESEPGKGLAYFISFPATLKG